MTLLDPNEELEIFPSAVDIKPPKFSSELEEIYKKENNISNEPPPIPSPKINLVLVKG
jgi:hypothetical protein